MRFANYSQNQIKRISRLLLVSFVFAWLNLAFQAPVHAGMMQSRDTMVQMDSMKCHCPPVVCESVVSLDNESMDGVYAAHLLKMDFQVAYKLPVSMDITPQHDLSYFTLEDIYSRSYSPPPLSLSGILLI
ncbi:MAG: hypothetical protein OEY43_03945 [Gammaproteobacteria bacterium]|nr:hypothetical protein [Gammaproteobacteria bacterium]